MLKVAILDDYQNVSQQFVDIEKLSGKYEIKIFSDPFADEAEVLEQLSDFEALLIMRERTPITKNIIDNLNKLKFIITSGLRNKSIDLDAAKKRKIIVCGTEINSHPTPELTWALILGLARNLKEEIDNMYQGYWQTSIGVELKGKILGVDIKAMDQQKNVDFIIGDIENIETHNKIINFFERKIDVVLSDMASNTSGNKNLDKTNAFN